MGTFNGKPLGGGIDSVPGVSPDHINTLSSKSQLSAGDVFLVWDSGNNLQKVKVTYGDLLTGLNIVDPTAHISDATLHFKIDDSNTSTDAVWSSAKTNQEVQAVTLTINGVQQQFNLHANDGTIHHVLNDNSNSSSEVFSAAKILDLVGNLESQVIVVQGASQAVSDALTLHEGNPTIHFELDDSVAQLNKVWSSQKVSGELGSINITLTQVQGDITQLQADVAALGGPHLQINDTSPTATEPYSGLKVDQELQAVHATYGALFPAVGQAQSEITAHKADASVHFRIDDSLVSNSQGWSSQKIDGEITTRINSWVPSTDPRVGQNESDILALQGDVSSLSNQVNANSSQIVANDTAMNSRVQQVEQDHLVHLGDVDIHRRLDDTQVSSSELWSSARIVQEVQSGVAPFGGDISQLQMDVVALQVGVSSAVAVNTQQSSDIAQLQTDVTALQGQVGNINAINQLQSDVAALQTSQAQQDTLIAGKENAFSKNSGFNLPLGTTAGTVAEGDHTHSQITTNENDINQLQLDVALLQGTQNFLNTQVTQNTGDISQLQSDISVVNSVNNIQDGRITQNETDISSLDARVTTNETDIGVLQSNETLQDNDIASNTSSISALDTRVTTVESQQVVQDNNISTNASDIVTERGRIDANIVRLDDHENRITTLENAGGGGGGAIVTEDLQPYLVAANSGFTNYNNTPATTGLATLLQKSSDGRVSLTGYLRNNTGATIGAASLNNILLATLPTGFESPTHHEIMCKINNGLYTGSGRIQVFNNELRFVLLEAGGVGAGQWFYINFQWVV